MRHLGKWKTEKLVIFIWIYLKFLFDLASTSLVSCDIFQRSIDSKCFLVSWIDLIEEFKVLDLWESTTCTFFSTFLIIIKESIRCLSEVSHFSFLRCELTLRHTTDVEVLAIWWRMEEVLDRHKEIRVRIFVFLCVLLWNKFCYFCARTSASIAFYPYCLLPKIRSIHRCRFLETLGDSNAYRIRNTNS